MKTSLRPSQVQAASEALVAGVRPFPEVFSEAVTVGLADVLGSAGARAAFFHLRLTQPLDAEEVHEGLARFFGAGTQALEASILRQLYARVGSSFDPQESMTFMGFVARAREMHSKLGGEPR